MESLCLPCKRLRPKALLGVQRSPLVDMATQVNSTSEVERSYHAPGKTLVFIRCIDRAWRESNISEAYNIVLDSCRTWQYSVHSGSYCGVQLLTACGINDVVTVTVQQPPVFSSRAFLLAHAPPSSPLFPSSLPDEANGVSAEPLS